MSANPDRECPRCGYVTQNDEVNRDVPPRTCPECGGHTVPIGRGGSA